MQNPNTTHEGNAYLGLVVSYFGNSVAVEYAGEEFQCHLRRNQALPVVGDWVRFQLENEKTGIVLSIEPRRSVLGRGDKYGKLKPIAANLDALVVVMAPRPEFSEYLIDRYVLAAELANITPIIVCNKIDLLSEREQESMLQRLAAYYQVPYLVMLTSVLTPNGLADLAKFLQEKTAVLVGPSGVGKSSIIQALSHSPNIRIADVSAKGAGKHTTTATRLYHLPGSGNLIDSPGVREFNLWPVSRAEILQGFKEFANYLGQCKFRDCQHLEEPGCAVQAAVRDGKINPSRYQNFKQFMQTAKIKSR